MEIEAVTPADTTARTPEMVPHAWNCALSGTTGRITYPAGTAQHTVSQLISDAHRENCSCAGAHKH